MWNLTSRQSQRLAGLVVGSSLFVYALHLAFYFSAGHEYYRGSLWEPRHQLSSSSPLSPGCRAYPSGDLEVVIVVKAGATETLARPHTTHHFSLVHQDG